MENDDKFHFADRHQLPSLNLIHLQIEKSTQILKCQNLLCAVCMNSL